jgi:hypothetical protein
MRALLAISLAFAAFTPFAACTSDAEPPASPAFIQAATAEEAGRYFFLIGGCNDCHTMGWAESKGKLPETEWALGNAVGFKGPWGTSYPANLRLSAAQSTERQWVQMFRQSAGLPPMPWQNYHGTPDADLVAIQRFLHSLGPRGKPAPEPLPPGKEPTSAYIDLTPRTPTGAPGP